MNDFRPAALETIGDAALVERLVGAVGDDAADLDAEIRRRLLDPKRTHALRAVLMVYIGAPAEYVDERHEMNARHYLALVAADSAQ